MRMAGNKRQDMPEKTGRLMHAVALCGIETRQFEQVNEGRSNLGKQRRARLRGTATVIYRRG